MQQQIPIRIRVFTVSSATRPQRGSRATSIIGENVQSTPDIRASCAVTAHAFFYQFRIPRASLSQRNRIHSTKSVNGIVTKNNRNAQTRFFHSLLLHIITQSRIGIVINQRTNFRRNFLTSSPILFTLLFRPMVY